MRYTSVKDASQSACEVLCCWNGSLLRTLVQCILHSNKREPLAQVCEPIAQVCCYILKYCLQFGEGCSTAPACTYVYGPVPAASSAYSVSSAPCVWMQ